jgi:DNA-binding MarR family transcriptional regulator
VIQTLLDETKYQILKENEGVFINYRRLLTPPQWQLLVAIGKENGDDEPTSKAFLLKYGLGAHSTVSRSLSALEDKQLIYAEYTSEDSKPVYKVYDLFLSKWIETL